jgi:WD40 repeat protein
LELLETLEGVRSVSFNHNGSQIMTVSMDNTIKIRDSFTGRLLHTLKAHYPFVSSIAWNHDSTKIALGSRNVIEIWGWTESVSGDGMSWKLLKTLKGHFRTITSVSWNHDSTRIVWGSWDGIIRIWDASTEELRTLNGHFDKVYSVSWILRLFLDQMIKL